jgi:biotin transport system substrate-specific component
MLLTKKYSFLGSFMLIRLLSFPPLLWRSSLVVRLVLSFLLVFVTSQITIPLYPVPVTAQTLSVLSLGILLPPAEAFLALLSWMFLGFCGLPVFSSFSAGFRVLVGPTSGYLLGMLVAAPLLSYIYRSYRLQMIKTPLLLLGVIMLVSKIILFLGCCRLALFLGSWSQSFWTGVMPFLPGDTLKNVILWMAWKTYIRVR